VDRLDALVGYLAPRYALVRARDLLAASRPGGAASPCRSPITFDDDLPSHLEHAAPVLARHGTPAPPSCARRRPVLVAAPAGGRGRRGCAPTISPAVDPRLVLDAVERVPRAILRLAAAIEGLPAGRPRRRAAALGPRVDAVPAPLGARASGPWPTGDGRSASTPVATTR
jgi:hypothetical protein